MLTFDISYSKTNKAIYFVVDYIFKIMTIDNDI